MLVMIFNQYTCIIRHRNINTLAGLEYKSILCPQCIENGVVINKIYTKYTAKFRNFSGSPRVFHFDLIFEIFAGGSTCRVKCAQKNV